MIIADIYLTCVVFLCTEEEDNLLEEPRLVPRATGFLIGFEAEGTAFAYIVTARHNIEAAAARRLYARVKTHEGFEDVPMDDGWHTHDTEDVAIGMFVPPPSESGFDLQLITPANFVDTKAQVHRPTFAPGQQALIISGIATGNMQPANEIPVGVGQDVFFVGLFGKHAGESRILPVVRYGRISRMPAEPLTLTRPDGTTMQTAGYLVEGHSFGGESGSPVFWHVPGSNLIEVDLPPGAFARKAIVPGELTLTGLLGIVSGHYDVEGFAKVEDAALGIVQTTSNSGIMVVTPAHHVVEVVDSPEAVNERRRRAADMKKLLPHGFQAPPIEPAVPDVPVVLETPAPQPSGRNQRQQSKKKRRGGKR